MIYRSRPSPIQRSIRSTAMLPRRRRERPGSGGSMLAKALPKKPTSDDNPSTSLLSDILSGLDRVVLSTGPCLRGFRIEKGD
uniref:Uncharacterized protein n=1 Tax=Nymphaea colorata TaxID=210225 RepID=A0A5K1G8G4_9MAGN